MQVINFELSLEHIASFQKNLAFLKKPISELIY